MTIKNTSISFGFLSIPVKVKVARKEGNDIPKSHQYCPSGHRINYKKYCEECEQEISWGDIKKGYKVGEDVVTLNKEDTKADIESIEVEGFDTEMFEPERIKDVYNLSPNGSTENYITFREYIKRNNLIPVGRVALRSKEELIAIIPKKKVLKLIKLYTDGEIRDEPEFEEKEVSEEKLEQLDKFKSEIKLSEIKNKTKEKIKAKIEEGLQTEKTEKQVVKC